MTVAEWAEWALHMTYNVLLFGLAGLLVWKDHEVLAIVVLLLFVGVKITTTWGR